VVIDRLPFPSPDDPVLDAISERDRRWFTNYSLPRAVIAFKQGFGRLIRSNADRGVVVVLDRRLVSKSYGKVFTGSLPKMLKSRRIESVQRFLDEGA
jgi:ATP-dependent DNA helicase DinG